MKRLIPMALLILSGCGPAALEKIAYMPPDELLHPYNGTVAVVPMDPNSPNVSMMEEKPSIRTAIIHLPAGHSVPTVSAPEFPTTMLAPAVPQPSRSAYRISDNLRRCLFLIELGAANGAQDVNADPSRRFIPAGYERTCADYDWSAVYAKLAPTAKWIGIQP